MTDQEREQFKEKLKKRAEQNKKSREKPKSERRTYGEKDDTPAQRIEKTRKRIFDK